MYFVATNHIEYFDRAVTRSQRFDAILYIGPPSFEAKKKKVLDILSGVHVIQAQFDASLTRKIVEDALPSPNIKEIEDAREKEDQDWLKAQPLPGEFVLSKFALLRWDELYELAGNLANSLNGKSLITRDVLEKALVDIRDSKSRSMGEYCRFVSENKYERYDVSKTAAWQVEGEGIDLSQINVPSVTPNGSRYIATVQVGSRPRVELPGYVVERLPEAKLKLRKVTEMPPASASSLGS